MRIAEGVGFERAFKRASEETTMTREQKIIRAKVGLLELAKQLCNVIQACRIIGFSLYS